MDGLGWDDGLCWPSCWTDLLCSVCVCVCVCVCVLCVWCVRVCVLCVCVWMDGGGEEGG